MAERIERFQDLDVYRRAKAAAIRIYEITKPWPAEERYSMTDQIRRSSRSVCANLGEAWRRRRYPHAFVAKLNDCESEASETIVWLELAEAFGYLPSESVAELSEAYEILIAKLVKMIQRPDQWTLK